MCVVVTPSIKRLTNLKKELRVSGSENTSESANSGADCEQQQVPILFENFWSFIYSSARIDKNSLNSKVSTLKRTVKGN